MRIKNIIQILLFIQNTSLEVSPGTFYDLQTPHVREIDHLFNTKATYLEQKEIMHLHNKMLHLTPNQKTRVKIRIYCSGALSHFIGQPI